MTRIATLSDTRNNCHNCRLRSLCLPDNLSKDDLGELDSIVQRRKPVARGAYLFQAGERFQSIFAVRTGAVKTLTVQANGDEHISGFHLPGEVIGLDAIVSRDHPSTAIALESTSVCEIPYAELESLGDRMPAVQHQLVRVMSRELLAEHHTGHLLTRRAAEQRLAVVLLAFSERFARRGLSALRFRLPMSRLDLGNYLGLVPETMSRTFRRLEEQGLVSITGKEIELVDICAMKALAYGNNEGGLAAKA
ncbi:CRP/FNR family transcriptional regulator [Modicisalibacter xianhensis]|uniref:CRP/FNR family transcriptional regulator n=1 Tax=Modicisalibacter xianhensis TaxID=442341 RepID=A0A4R8G2Y8_9GAMM|nr:fumarate/nitrate reduction transcriptional regulator Fnr [Halomonas xianhensis]TDX29436.1 CRP/FNR family transcriptional regulator [Halomonas xianhensis]